VKTLSKAYVADADEILRSCFSDFVVFDAIMGSKSDREVVQLNLLWRWRALC
jgi:hypothetical protein